MKKENLWQAILAQVQLNLSPANFATWFKNTCILEIKKDILIIGVPNNFSKEWIEKRYKNTLLKIARQFNQEIKAIEFRVISKKDKKFNFELDLSQIHPDQLRFEELYINKETSLNPRYQFENFVVGPFNELAHAAAWAVSESPGTLYNPLFIYGGVGLGKTHLLQAIGNRITKVFPEKKVRYVSSERFTGGVINAIKNQTIEQFKEKYRQYDVLIIDDIQFIAGKEKTQEEFFHLFNTLYESNKQIVISSDRPPKAISALEARLKSRFEGGMIADISSPDFESRVAILKQKAQEKNFIIDDSILEFIAANIQSNIRELEGALNRLIAYQKMGNLEILDLETARKLLKKVIQPKHKKLDFQKLTKIVAEFYNLSQKDLLSTSRKQEIVKARQIAMYLLREEVKYSFPLIGRKFGGKDHTTVIYAYQKLVKELEKNEDLAEEMNLLKEKLYSE
ncbi:MAG: chromosomal replication initiator protein DnaA [Candidatus Pacebacteria bacterium]|nr:chromosomal replication initiator protein DnaA [Candidatus Paceibacterota bacterium]